MKVLMVCLGNICRSPLAEGILKHKVKLNNLNWLVDSAGTNGYHNGENPHNLSIKVARQNNVDISKQISRKLVKEDIKRFDKIYVMDEENFAEAKRIFGNEWDESKVDYLLNLSYPNENRAVPDPWYGGEDGYHKVYAMIDEACEKLLNNLLPQRH